MKLSTFILLAVSLAVATAGIILVAHSHSDIVWFPVDSERLPYHFTVDTTPGIDVGMDMLRLGAATTGSTNRRDVTVDHESAGAVQVRVTGEGRGLLVADPQRANFTNGTATIEFSVRARNETPAGQYTGDIVFYFVNN